MGGARQPSHRAAVRDPRISESADNQAKCPRPNSLIWSVVALTHGLHRHPYAGSASGESWQESPGAPDYSIVQSRYFGLHRMVLGKPLN